MKILLAVALCIISVSSHSLRHPRDVSELLYNSPENLQQDVEEGYSYPKPAIQTRPIFRDVEPTTVAPPPAYQDPEPPIVQTRVEPLEPLPAILTRPVFPEQNFIQEQPIYNVPQQQPAIQTRPTYNEPQPNYIQSGPFYREPAIQNRPIYREPEIQSRPIYREPEIQTRPIYREPEIQTRPIYREPEIQTRPIYREPEIQTRPIYREPEIQTRPIYREPEIQTRPIYREPDIQTRPIYRPQVEYNKPSLIPTKEISAKILWPLWNTITGGGNGNGGTNSIGYPNIHYPGNYPNNNYPGNYPNNNYPGNNPGNFPSLIANKFQFLSNLIPNLNNYQRYETPAPPVYSRPAPPVYTRPSPPVQPIQPIQPIYTRPAPPVFQTFVPAAAPPPPVYTRPAPPVFQTFGPVGDGGAGVVVQASIPQQGVNTLGDTVSVDVAPANEGYDYPNPNQQQPPLERKNGLQFSSQF